MIGKDNLVALLVAAVGMAVFVSCENKPRQDSEESLIVGEWVPVSWVHFEIADGEVVFQNTGALDTNRTFHRDGTGRETRNFGDYENDNWQTIYSFKWTLADDKIYFTDVKFTPPEGIVFGDLMWKFETEWSVIDLTATEMKVEFTQESTSDDYNGYVHNIVTYEKVK